jgi:hypothetical protein
MVTHSADSRYVIIMGIVVDVFVSANIEIFIMLSCFKLITLVFLKTVVLNRASNIIGNTDKENTSLGIKADK